MRPGRVGSSPLRSPTRETRVPVATLPKESKFILINHLQGQTYFRKQKAQLQNLRFGLSKTLER